MRSTLTFLLLVSLLVSLLGCESGTVDPSSRTSPPSKTDEEYRAAGFVQQENGTWVLPDSPGNYDDEPQLVKNEQGVWVYPTDEPGDYSDTPDSESSFPGRTEASPPTDEELKAMGFVKTENGVWIVPEPQGAPGAYSDDYEPDDSNLDES